jgi:glucosamine 6-phosphate synthetase-like amidotransferase/phosphosugar isomerase protein
MCCGATRGLDRYETEFRPFLRFHSVSGDEPKLAKICDDVILIPHCPDFLSPILTSIPLQLLAYHTSVALGCDVDKPRNLAKSVTVE